MQGNEMYLSKLLSRLSRKSDEGKRERERATFSIVQSRLVYTVYTVPCTG